MTHARLIKKATADGLFEFKDDVTVGSVYHVDLVHARLFDLYNVDKQVRLEIES